MSSPLENNFRRARPLLGTFVEIGARRQSSDALDCIDAAFATIAEIEGLLSFHSATSDLTRLNREPGKQVSLHRTSLRVLGLARAMTIASSGTFNCTVGGALVHAGALPDHGGRRALDMGDAGDIELGPGWARLRRPVLITLDGIAKGYAVDRAIALLKRCGASAGWVNAGGDLRIFGDLTLPLHRREMDGCLTALGHFGNVALASSLGAAKADERYPAALVGPAGALPTAGVWSVLADSAWRADALTKVACFAATNERAALVERLGGYLLPTFQYHGGESVTMKVAA